jgi:hypothetical protein
MRISEFKFSDLVDKGMQYANPNNWKDPGTSGVAGAKARAKKSGLSSEDQLTQDIFVKKFVSRGLNSIKTAVEQGIVDVNDIPAQPAAGQSQPNTAQTQPAAGATPAPGSAAAAAASVKKGQAPGDQAIATGQKQGVAKPQVDMNVDKIVSAMRKLQPAGTKPLPPESKMAKEIAADMDKVALNKDYLLRVGDRILKANNAGYDVKDLHRQFMGQHAKGIKNKSIQEAKMFDLLVKLVTESQFRKQVRESGHDPDIVITRFRTLLENSTNEGIMDKVKGFFKGKPAQPQPAAPAQPQPAAPAGQAPAAQAPAGSGKTTLGKWFKDTFMTNFLRGINLDAAMPQIQKILDNMGASYKAGTIAKDLQNIAMIAFAQSDMGKTQDRDPKPA